MQWINNYVVRKTGGTCLIWIRVQRTFVATAIGFGADGAIRTDFTVGLVLVWEMARRARSAIGAIALAHKTLRALFTFGSAANHCAFKRNSWQQYLCGGDVAGVELLHVRQNCNIKRVRACLNQRTVPIYKVIAWITWKQHGLSVESDS